GLHQILRIEWIADLVRIESFPLVRDPDLQVEALQLEGGVHLLPHVELVAVLDGIRHGFADGHADPMRSVFIQPCVFAEMFRDHLNELDVLKSAADSDLDPLAVPCHRVNRGDCNGITGVYASFASACPAVFPRLFSPSASSP